MLLQVCHVTCLHRYDVWAVVYTLLRQFGKEVAGVDEFAGALTNP